MPPFITNYWYIKLAVLIVIIAIVLLIIFWPRKTTQSTNNFTCPAPGTWVDCMPKVINSQADQNAMDYCDFVKAHCPDAQIAL